MANSLPSVDPELAFVQEASIMSSRALAKPGRLDWTRVLDLAIYHRVYPRVAHSAAALMPDDVRTRITALAQANATAALGNIAQTSEAVQMLEAQTVDVIVLKGPLLARELYGDFGLRVAGDVDLLVRESDFLRAARILCDAGYRPGVAIGPRSLRRHRRRQHDVGFVAPDGATLIELHADLAQPHYGVQFELEKWWAKRRTVDVGSTQLCVLKPEHAYLFAAIHAAKHRWERLDLVCDLAVYAQKPLDWPQIHAEAAEAWMLKAVRTGQIMARVFFGEIGETNAASRIASRKLVAAQSFGRMDGIRFDLGLRDRNRDQLRYLWRRLLSAKLEV